MKRHAQKGLIWIVAATGLFCGVTAGAFLALTRDLPQIQSLENYKPSAITRIYSADHVLLKELFVEKRDPVPLSQIPERLKTALLTTEDRRFYDHSGLAIKGILRAMIQNIRKGRFAQGASTLTQQLAKTLFLTPRKTLGRKLREAVLALQLERRYTKDEILSLYLNQIYFGSGAYGVASAARVYFNKPVQNLTLAQCALIAGLPRAPTRYSPLINPDLAVKRRNIVLSQMLATGAIDESDYLAAIEENLPDPQPKSEKSEAPYFIEYIVDALEGIVGDNQLYKSGLTVHTTLSFQYQKAAQEAVAKGLAQLETRRIKNQLEEQQPQAALVSVNVSTGSIVAMIGGREATNAAFNRATTSRRQPGSAFKPIVYALAIERGFQPFQKILDAPVVFESPSQKQEWQPQNFSQTYDGEICLRWALAHSKNIAAVRLLEKLSPSSVIQFGQTLGLRTPLNPNLSLALGTSEVGLLELTAAYAVFANQGKYIAPYGITEIVDAEGQTIWRAKPEQHIAMSRSGAAVITNMLEAVIQEGTGRKAESLPGPLAGKTGTTNDYKDALFIGYSPQIVTGVWVGNDDASTLGPQETGARAALPIWMEFMQQVLARQSQRYFDIPENVRQIYIHPRTGEPLTANSKEAVKVLIKSDTPPSD
jgi:penicillin-binding protein 1A